MSEKILADKFLRIVRFYQTKVQANQANSNDKINLIRAVALFWYYYCQDRPKTYSTDTLNGYKSEYLFPNNAVKFRDSKTCILTNDFLDDYHKAITKAHKIAEI